MQAPALTHPDELDELTLRRAQRGDARAQTDLIHRYQGALFAVVGRMLVGSREDVEDVAQESFLKVLRGLPSFDPNGRAKLSTWILTIATRTCIDVLRANRRRQPHEPPPEEESPGALSSPGPSPEREIAHRQLGRRVEAAVAQLDPEHRAVLILRAYHDLDYPEIATMLNLELGTVKSRLARARSALRRATEEPT